MKLIRSASRMSIYLYIIQICIVEILADTRKKSQMKSSIPQMVLGLARENRATDLHA